MKRSSITSKHFFFFAVFITSFFPIAKGQKILLHKDMVYSELGDFADAGAIVDEQTLAGNPDDGTGGKPITSFYPGINGHPDLYYPGNVVLDLKGQYKITKVYLYNSEGSAKITISSGSPYSWKILQDVNIVYQTWKGQSLDETTRYLRFSVPNVWSRLTEVVVYGTLVPGTAIIDPSPKIQEQPDFDQFMGTNVTHYETWRNLPATYDQYIDRLKAVTVVREYHQWMWDEGNIWPFGESFVKTGEYSGYPKNINRWKNNYQGWNSDELYSKMNDAELIPAPVIQSTVAWLSKTMTDKPTIVGADPTNPKSYIEHADHMFQFAAHYGSNRSLSNTLLKTDEAKTVGLNTVPFIEDFNEQDSWWVNREAYFNPTEYAAMASADYDGHKSTLGTNIGVKNADPNTKMVMGGLALLNLDYVKAMKAWSDKYRGESFPADVINFHHYSNNGKGIDDNATSGISPEEDQLKEKLRQIVDYRNKYLPGKEVWMSEFGYDTHPESVFRAPAIGSYSAAEVQGQWLVRSFLEMYAAGLDRAMIFQLDEIDPNNSQKFSTCGITTNPSSGYKPKIAWYYIYTLKNILKGMKFVKDEVVDNTHMYSFKNPSGDEGVIVVWNGTSKGQEDWNVQIPVPNASSATLVTMKDGSIQGESSALKIETNGRVKVYVSERPVFIKVNKMAGATATTKDLKSQIQVYPEITDGEVFINLSDNLNAGSYTVTIVDNKGILKQKTSFTPDQKRISLNLENYPAGLYIVNVECGNGMMSQKVVKY